MLQGLVRRAFPNWPAQPIKGVSLSAGGLLALADLSTIAQRTAITGGSSWMDMLVLAPGLHYQQAADELAKGYPRAIEEKPVRHGDSPHHGVIPGGGGSGEGGAGTPRFETVVHRVINAATIHYMHRVSKPGRTVVLDVGPVPTSPQSTSKMSQAIGQRSFIFAGDQKEKSGKFSWFSHLLYLLSPVLTVTAIVFMILFRDCKWLPW